MFWTRPHRDRLYFPTLFRIGMALFVLGRHGMQFPHRRELYTVEGYAEAHWLVPNVPIVIDGMFLLAIGAGLCLLFNVAPRISAFVCFVLNNLLLYVASTTSWGDGWIATHYLFFCALLFIPGKKNGVFVPALMWVRLQCSMVYLWTVLHRVGSSAWAEGDALTYAMLCPPFSRWADPAMLALTPVLRWASHFGLAVEVAAAFIFILPRRWAAWLCWFVILFHVTLLVVSTFTLWQFLMIVAMLSYADETLLERLFGRFVKPTVPVAMPKLVPINAVALGLFAVLTFLSAYPDAWRTGRIKRAANAVLEPVGLANNKRMNMFRSPQPNLGFCASIWVEQSDGSFERIYEGAPAMCADLRRFRPYLHPEDGYWLRFYSRRFMRHPGAVAEMARKFCGAEDGMWSELDGERVYFGRYNSGYRSVEALRAGERSDRYELARVYDCEDLSVVEGAVPEQRLREALGERLAGYTFVRLE